MIKITESLTISDYIQEFLYQNGKQKPELIFNHIKQFRPTIKLRTVYATLRGNRHRFVNCNGGGWNLIKDTKEERLEKLFYKLIVLKNHYQNKLNEMNLNSDTRCAGVDFEEWENDLMQEIYQKYYKN